ncbi:MAG: hypothetical protein SCABRO_00660 [Candidatus Scalindua brodae]|uniref:DUF3987 domain-containing protein n=1 Tax=Candidatus Scalindua brodae TaxID=237368 RepID=A0A0B0ESG4_9BACT|nr:MAG: hypothetical protein SCABRO_00660 [Candidatus Scalindua brodae]
MENSEYRKQDKQDLQDKEKTISKKTVNADGGQVEVDEVSIDERLMPVIPFPHHVFPKQLQKFIREVSKSIHINTEMVASAVLPIISSAIGNSVRVSPKADWLEPVFIWLIIIELTGRGKSPLLKILSKHIKQLQSLSEKKFSEEMNTYNERIKSNKNKKEKDEIINPNIDGCQSGYVKKPKRKHYFVQSFTIESLTNVFDDDPRGSMVYRDELAGLILSLNQYKKSAGDDRQHMLELWDAGEWKIDRKKRK